MRILYLVLIFIVGIISGLSGQNSSLLFDGTSTKVEVSDNDVFDIGANFTIEAWINASVWKAEAWAGTIVAKDNQGPDSGFAFRAGKDGSLSFVMSVNQTWVEALSSPIMEANVWNHVAAVVNNGTIKLFVNANEVASQTYTGSPTANTIAMTIGESAGFPGRVFNGRIDEVRIWNSSRTQAEISDNYTNTLNGDEAGLVGYYDMNEGDGQILNNLAQTTSGIDGTLQGFSGGDFWVEGFELPQNDVGIKALIAPDIITAFDRPAKVKIQIQNFGFNSLSDIPVGYTLSGGFTVEEIANVTLNPGETYIHTFEKVANFTNANQSILSLFTKFTEDTNDLNDEISIVYEKPGENDLNIINALDQVQHNFGAAGQTQFTSILLPQDLSVYEQILMHLKVECPTGGCDPWDQPGKISIVNESGEYEIGRFITPFGIGTCGPWTIDVTDFKTLLQGAIALKSFIQVWGASGWLLSVDFELVAGSTSNPFQKLSPLWLTDYHVYGDPSVSDDLALKSVTVSSNTSTAHLRMTVSGHGQGNTDNAAEFSEKTHEIIVNGTKVMDHHLWKADCNSNACSPQNGTWQFNRAGWCPGEAVNPLQLDISDRFEPGEEVTIDYELQQYENLLNTGYNGGSHTEPHYRIWGYLIETSQDRFNDYTNLSIGNIELASDTVNEEVTFGPLSLIITNTGNQVVSNPSISYYVNGDLISNESLLASISPGQSVEFEFSTLANFQKDNDYEIIAVLSQAEDQNTDDDAAIFRLTEATVTSIASAVDHNIKVFPNPSSDNRFKIEGLIKDESYTIKLYNQSGRIIGHWRIKNKTHQVLEISATKVSVLTVETQKGERMAFQILNN